MNAFIQMKVSAPIVERLEKMGITKPMPVQEQAIPAFLSGRDVMARAQTGTGKTLAFLVPIAQKLNDKKKFVQALVLSPTRELAQQTATEMKKLLTGTEFKAALIVGGRDVEEQKHKLAGNAQVLIGTPGRILDHIRRQNVDLGGVQYFVLDEVDEMLQQGFAEEVMTLEGMVQEKHQTMLCSATFSEEVVKLGRKITKNCAQIDIDPDTAVVAKIKQVCIKTTEEFKNQAVTHLIDRLNPYLMLIFCISKERAQALGEYLGEQGYNADVLTGTMSPAKRRTVMKNFRSAKLQILVASDIAARGLDVEGVTQVINYDIPHNVDWYVHRVGRTGRAGRDGLAITLYTIEDLRWLHNIEKKLGLQMEKQNLDGKVLARRPARIKTTPKKTRGRNSVLDKRHAPKTGSNRRQVKRGSAAAEAAAGEGRSAAGKGRSMGKAGWAKSSAKTGGRSFGSRSTGSRSSSRSTGSRSQSFDGRSTSRTAKPKSSAASYKSRGVRAKTGSPRSKNRGRKSAVPRRSGR